MSAPAKPLFLYLKGVEITPAILAKIKRAGYCPVEVPSFDVVRIVEVGPVGGTAEITRAAMAAIAESGYDSVRQSFGGRVAKHLSKSP